MFERSAIETAGTDLVGWRSSTNQYFAGLPSYLKSSTSGYYVNELPGITLDLVESVAQEQTISSYLQNVHKNELVNLISQFTHNLKDKVNSKELLSNATLIQKRINFDELITKSSRFLGYAIYPKQSKSIKATIEHIGLYANTLENITIYLFETSQSTAIATHSFTGSKTNSLEWEALTDFTIEYESLDKGTGNQYLIGYFEDDLTGSLYDEEYDGESANIAKQIFGRYMGVVPVRIESSHLNGTNLPDCEYMEGWASCKTPGFNLKFNVKCDLTDTIVQNISMFGQPLQYAISIRILEDAINSLNLNKNISPPDRMDRMRQLRAQYRGELYGGNAQVGEAIVYQSGIMDKLTMDFSDMDAICLPCKKDIITGGQLIDSDR